LDFVGNRKIWYGISILLIVVGLLFLGIRGLNLGIDFRGGSLIEYMFEERVTLGEFREVLAQVDLDDEGAVVQPSDQEEIFGILLRTRALTPEESESLTNALRAEFGSAEQLRAEIVWPTIGEELTWRAILALVVASLVIIVYLSIRFEPKYAMAALLAVLHDALIVIGFFALVFREVNTPFVAGLLTIIGYSINDSIVIFDRIRENKKFKRYKDYKELVNASIIANLPRSINTSVTTLLCVTAIFLFGGVTIKAFMLTLLVGFIAGTYSSIFIASPFLITIEEKIPFLRGKEA